MFTWLTGLFSKPLSPMELRDRQLSDPELFTEKQREHLRSLFPKYYTHLDNFSQEELLKLANTLVIFGYNIRSERDFVESYDMLVMQDIIAVNPHNGYLIRRA